MTQENFDMNYLINTQYSPSQKEPDQFNFALSGAMYIENPAPMQQSETELIGLAMAEQVDLEEDDDAADDEYFCDLCDGDEPAGFSGDGYYNHFNDGTLEVPLGAPLGAPLDTQLPLETPLDGGHWKWEAPNYLETQIQMGYGSNSVVSHHSVMDETRHNGLSEPGMVSLEPVAPLTQPLASASPPSPRISASKATPALLDCSFDVPSSPADSDVEYHPEQEGVEEAQARGARKRSRGSNLRFTGKRQRQRREKYVCQVQTGGIACGKTFGRPYDLERHADIHNPNRQTFHCKYCPGAEKLFSRQDALTRHIKNKHGLDE